MTPNEPEIRRALLAMRLLFLCETMAPGTRPELLFGIPPAHRRWSRIGNQRRHKSQSVMLVDVKILAIKLKKKKNGNAGVVVAVCLSPGRRSFRGPST